MRQTFDFSVYFVADPSACAGRDVGDVVLAAVAGGATMVQYRNKTGDMARIMADAAMLSELLKSSGVPFLINDYPDVAFAVGAHGVHIGQGDVSAVEARAQLGAEVIIGLTAFTPAHIGAVDPSVVDYIGTGPFYETQTDKGKPVLGAQAFAELAVLSPVPVVGIGGITADNAHEVLHAGANGVAMMRAISEADDPEAAARKFKEAVQV